jgi:hypothetical protein
MSSRSACTLRNPPPCCHDKCVRWLVTLEGNPPDVERLLGESWNRLSVGETPDEVVLEIRDAEHDVATDESRQAVRALIEAAVRHLNGLGKLRWGRSFEGLTVRTVRYIDAEGRPGLVGFVGTAYDHMFPEDFAAMVERLGFPRPELPVGVEDVNALDLANVAALSDDDPEVARVLHLVELMLVGDDDIDWVAGYAALE